MYYGYAIDPIPYPPGGQKMPKPPSPADPETGGGTSASLTVKLRQAEWDQLMNIKHRLEKEGRSLLTVTEVVRACISRTHAVFIGEETHAGAERGDGDRPKRSARRRKAQAPAPTPPEGV